MRHCPSFNKSVLYEIIRKKFERPGNRVQGWSQRALVGTFMGGLRPEIADGIRKFKSKTLKEAISLAIMQED